MTRAPVPSIPAPAKGLSARTFKRDIVGNEADPVDALTTAPIGPPLPEPSRHARFRRAPFYLKIDGLTGPRPGNDSGET